MTENSAHGRGSSQARSLQGGVLAGAIGAVIVAAAEPLVSRGGDAVGLLLVWVASAALLLPLGILVGIALWAVLFLLGDENRPSRLLKVLVSPDNPHAAGRLIAVGLSLLLAIPALFRVVFHFLTAYRHKGLAALALAAAVTGLLLFLAPAVSKLSRVMERGLDRVGQSIPAVKKPLVALAVVAIMWSALLIPPLAKGPDAAGLFGFVGFLRKDGLEAGPLISTIAIAAFAAFFMWLLPRSGSSRLAPFALACLVAGAAGPPVANAIVERDSTALEVMNSGRGVVTMFMKLGRSLGDGDGDGHGRWLGGRDCDDENRAVHPGARDVPNNGVDEDCSGADLDVESLKKRFAEAAAPAPRQDLKRPEIPSDASLLMITLDSLRWDAPGFMGYKRDITPNLDRVAAKGVVYTRAYALGSYTAQAIPPLLTGKYASELIRNDRHETRVSKKETFAAEAICGKEVKCAAFMTHFLFEPDYGWSQGFDEWRVVGAEPVGPGHIDSKYNSHIATRQAIRWLADPENTKGRFWLWVHYMDPHREYLEHPGFKKFGEDRRSKYDGEVLFTDHHVGALLDYFEKLPAAERTIIMITSDHGEAFNEHGRWCHGMELWEEIVRVPLVVAGPGIPKKSIERQTSLIDVFPTLLSLFDAPIPKAVHGRSLLPDWVPGQELEERPIFIDQPQNPYYEARRAFIKDGWKLHHLPDVGSYRLFELTDDYERGDSLVKSEPEKFEELKAAYDLFVAAELKPVPAVKFHGADLSDMDAPQP